MVVREGLLKVGTRVAKFLPRRMTSAVFHALVSPEDVLRHRDDGWTLLTYRKHWAALELGNYEPITRREFLKRVRPGNVLVDGGANAGLFTVLGSRAVGASGHVHAFEPHPDVAGVLDRNVRENGLTNVTIHRCGLGNAKSHARLYHDATEPGSHSLHGHGAKGFDVPIERLDDIVDAVDFVKLDVEGHEAPAITGMEKLIARSRPAIMVEISSSYGAPESLAETLAAIGGGYQFEYVEENASRGPTRFELPELIHKTGEFAWNVFCTPRT